MDWKEGEKRNAIRYYMIFVTLKENSSIVPINLIKLAKKNTNTASDRNKKEGFIHNRYHLTTILKSGLIIKSARRVLIILG